jgi:hypothetical protein
MTCQEIFLWYSISGMKRIRKWYWLIAAILAIALIIGWEEKRCQSQANQCKAEYTAQAQLERLSGNISVYQQASEQQAIAAACEPNGYFCPLLSATNLPTLLLVLIGIAGIYAALQSLDIIKRQADSMARQIKLQEIAIQQWVETENWEASCRLLENGDIAYDIKFDVVNTTAYPLTLATISTTIATIIINSNDEISLVPRDRHRADTGITLTKEQANAGTAHNLTVWITYRDVFKKTKTQVLGKFCSFQGSMVHFSAYQGTLPQLLKTDEEYEEEQEFPN